MFPQVGNSGPHALSFQVVLSFAAVATSAHGLNPLSLISLSTVLLHVSCGRPRFRFPSGTQVRVMRGCEWWSILSTWPSHVHLRFSTLGDYYFEVSFNVKVILSNQKSEWKYHDIVPLRELNGKENVTFKMTSQSLKLLADYSNLFNLSNAVQYPGAEFVRTAYHFRKNLFRKLIRK